LTGHYENLISNVDNHLYYNLEHYYAVLRALPGGEKNIENWHRMIGGKLDEVQIPYHATGLNKFETFVTVLTMMKLIVQRKNIFKDFTRELDQKKMNIEKDAQSLKTPSEIISYLGNLIEQPLGFGLTVVNDVFIMMGLGYLTKILKKENLRDDKIIDLLKTHEGVDSLKPLELFNLIVNELSGEFIDALAKNQEQPGFYPYVETFKKLRELGYKKEVNGLEDFLHKYGDRSFEELKLESLPLRNNPKLLIDLIKFAKSNALKVNTNSSELLNIELTLIQRKVLAFTRDCIAMREATRLWRGRFYHLLRNLILKLGQSLCENDVRFREFNVFDFFSLNHLEWTAFKEGKLDFESLRTLILQRRGWQTQKKNYPEMIQWLESEQIPTIDISIKDGELIGQGVSPGEVEGVALVLENPNEALESELKNFILVTKNTDPAWVYIMSRSLGLISEKGSLLSHTAIIGRELGIPTIVGVKSATQMLKTGDRIRMNSVTGSIKKI